MDPGEPVKSMRDSVLVSASFVGVRCKTDGADAVTSRDLVGLDVPEREPVSV